jgi:hypothetical protein
MDSKKSLWGDLSQVELFRTPFTILKEQAAILSEQTKGLLVGEIQRAQDSSKVTHLSMHILAPSLGNYRYEVVDVQHEVAIYPLIIFDKAGQPPKRCHSEQEFEQSLGEILASQKTKKVISALLSDIQANHISDDVPF